MMAQQWDDHAHPKQVLTKKQTSEGERLSPTEGFQLLTLSGFYHNRTSEQDETHKSNV